MSSPSSPSPSPQSSAPNWRLQAARIAALLLVVGITVLIFLYRNQAEWIVQKWGLFGIFVFSILANATLVLPAPQLLVVAAMGEFVSPMWVGLAAGLGATIGELSGYLAGFSGQAVIENRKLYNQLEEGMKRYGAAVIAVLGFLPLPFFDLAGIAAGALKMPVQKFLFWCAVGKIPKMTLVAYAGAYSIDWIMRWLN